jgi:hypothetical protein
MKSPFSGEYSAVDEQKIRDFFTKEFNTKSDEEIIKIFKEAFDVDEKSSSD